MKEYQAEALFTDIVLLNGDSQTPLHKMVVSMASRYFKKILIERDIKCIVVPAPCVEQSAIRKIVDFLYDGVMMVGDREISDIIKLAETLHLDDLVRYSPLIC